MGRPNGRRRKARSGNAAVYRGRVVCLRGRYGDLSANTLSFCLFWVFEVDADTLRSARVSLLTPLGTMFAGLITFATVAWRGMVASRQANEQRRQNDANETANYVSLLEREPNSLEATTACKTGLPASP